MNNKNKELNQILPKLKNANKECNSELAEISLYADYEGNNEMSIDKYGTIVGKISGGLNGCGKWSDYFLVLSSLIKILEEKYNVKAWLIKMENDCIDDIFYGEFGFEIIKPSKEIDPA